MTENTNGLSAVARRLRLMLGRFGLGNPAERMSVGPAELMDELSGKTIAIIGNSRALEEQKYGAEIDASELVIRINRAPIPAASSHGTKTGWLALATSLARSEYDRIQPRRLLWMSHKRKRLRAWMVEMPGFYLHPIDQHRNLSADLAAPPTTGIMVIDLVAHSNAGAVKIFGFDFFASQSLTGSRSAAQVPHDFVAEKKWLDDLVRRDPRFTVFG